MKLYVSHSYKILPRENLRTVMIIYQLVFPLVKRKTNLCKSCLLTYPEVLYLPRNTEKKEVNQQILATKSKPVLLNEHLDHYMNFLH